jgi:hypothetical protein
MIQFLPLYILLSVLLVLLLGFMMFILVQLIKHQNDLPPVRSKRYRWFKKKIITRDDGDAYLVRYSLFSCRWFALKVHNILLSDPSCPHDHPWAFITFILRGGYVEHTLSGSKYRGIGSVLYRPANYVHRLEVDKPVWSFVITFKKTRSWGFYTKSGWVHWRFYESTNRCD